MVSKRLFNQIIDSRGSAIIMALVTITILMLLGLAAITLSMGTLNSNVADATTNDSYYAAEAGVNAGLDQLKLEVSRYYTQMKAASGTTYNNLFNNFATGIATNAKDNFTNPSITGGSTQTTFTVESYDSANNVYGFLVTTTSTMADGTKYQVQGRLNVKRVDVSAKEWFIDKGALVVGKTLTVNQSSGLTVNGGDAVLGALVNKGKFEVNPPGQTIIDANVIQSINDVLNYPSFSDPTISNPKYYITQNTTMTDKNYPWTTPVSVDTASGVSLTISNTNIIPAGIIRARGDLTVNSGGNVYSDIYCQNFTDYGRAYYGNIYCHGNFTKTGGDIFGNVYCDGNVTLSRFSAVTGFIICGGNITTQGGTISGSLFAGDTINLSTDVTGNVVYAKNKIISRASISAIVFSGGDIEFGATGWTINGAVIAKNYMSNTGWWKINYKASDVAAKLANIKGTFFDTGGGSTAVDSSIFSNQSITAIGRVN